MKELDVRSLSSYREGWSTYLPEVLFHCSTALYWWVSTFISWLLLIQIATQRMIFPFFFPDTTDRGYLYNILPGLFCLFWLEFCKFICSIPRLHTWYYLSCVRQNTLYSGFFPTFFSLLHWQFLYYTSMVPAFGTLDLLKLCLWDFC